MDKITVKSRKMPVIIGTTILIVLSVVFAVIMSADPHSAAGNFLGGLVTAMLVLIVFLIVGNIRCHVTISKDGIDSVTSAFGSEKHYNWSRVRDVTQSGKYDSIASKDGEWIGSIDLRSAYANEAVVFLKKKKIPFRTEK